MIEVSWDSHPELYNDHELALDYCRNIIHPTEPPETVFHTQWMTSSIGRKQAMSIKAFLATQNLDKCRLIVWVDRPATTKWAEEVKHPRVEFQIFDPDQLAKGSPLEAAAKRSDNRNRRFCNYDHTDILRLLVLFQYGGIWIDMDTVPFRDFAPVLHQEFTYQWGRSFGQSCGGIIRMFKESGNVGAILEHYTKHHRELGPTRELFDDLRPTVEQPWAVWPSAWFNTEWGVQPSFRHDDPEWFKFIRSSHVKTKWSHEMFDGCFAWHWHNEWEREPEEGSKWCLVEKRVTDLFDAKFK